MITAKEIKESMVDSHMMYKKALIKQSVEQIEFLVQDAAKKMKVATVVTISRLIHQEVLEILKENGYKVTSNGSDEFQVDWGDA
jgi:hypothetical protein